MHCGPPSGSGPVQAGVAATCDRPIESNAGTCPGDAMPSRHLTRTVSHSVTLIAISVALGCSERGTGSPRVSDADGPAAMGLLVAGEAADRLQPDGTFRLPSQRPSARPQIDEIRAREIASAFIATHLAGFRSALERDRGASIDVKSVTVCPRIFYAESAFEDLPSEVPGVYHRLYGPWWLATLCSPGGESVVALGISAYATELGIEAGKLTYPAISGGEFRVVGIPPGEDNRLPITPEAAVRRAAGMANRRITAIPRLLLRLPGSAYPQLAQWHLTLDSDAQLEIAGTPGTVRGKEIFVGAEYRAQPSVTRANSSQPDAVEVQWRPSPRIGDPQGTPLPPLRTTRLARRPETPIVFSRIIRGQLP